MLSVAPTPPLFVSVDVRACDVPVWRTPKSRDVGDRVKLAGGGGGGGGGDAAVPLRVSEMGLTPPVTEMEPLEAPSALGA